MPSRGGRHTLILNILDRPEPNSLTASPPNRASTMRARRAKTVPPGAAMEPRMVQAARKMETVERRSVRKWAERPLGGQLGQGEEGEEEGAVSTVLTVLGEGLAR